MFTEDLFMGVFKKISDYGNLRFTENTAGGQPLSSVWYIGSGQNDTGQW